MITEVGKDVYTVSMDLHSFSEKYQPEAWQMLCLAAKLGYAKAQDTLDYWHELNSSWDDKTQFHNPYEDTSESPEDPLFSKGLRDCICSLEYNEAKNTTTIKCSEFEATFRGTTLASPKDQVVWMQDTILVRLPNEQWEVHPIVSIYYP